MRTLSTFVFVSVLTFNLSSQTKKTNSTSDQFFDEKTAIEQAIAKGIKPSEVKGYVQFLKNDFSSKKALANQPHKHNAYENNGDVLEKVIYLSPNTPMSADCPNMGFEQYNFNGWTGEIGTTSPGPIGGNPIYTNTGTNIVNSAGNNVSLVNTTNYHTIMSLPAVNPNYLTINGYDSVACKAVGTQTISEIPVVSPYSSDQVSVRLNGAAANNRACRLKYITTTSSSNQRISFSYAVVIQSPAGHLANESPYFKIDLINETTSTPLSSCTSFTINPINAMPSDSLKQSVIGSPGDPTVYRKWQYYSVDLSSLALGTNVSINFEVGGCTQSGHWGYAYVDAECGGSGAVYSNMCPGTTFATLVAPTGFNTYQWYNSSGIILGETNDTLHISGAVVGTTYTVNMTTSGGCMVSQNVTVNFSNVSISNIISSASCPNGNSGTASVLANGSNGTYTYTWTSTSGPNLGSIVSNSQTANSLSAGSYSVIVSSAGCGQASGNISIGIAPPFFTSLTKAFCGNSTKIVQTGGSNYLWYFGSTIIPASIGTNDTLYINNAVSGDKYTVVYNNASGCKDSIAYTLSQITSGSAYISTVKNVCPSNANGSSLVTVNPIFPPPYNFTLQNSMGVISNSTTSSTTFSATNLAAGNYTTTVTDGNCTYNNTFTINTIQTNFTMTPGSSNSCSPSDPAKINFDFGTAAPSNCALSSTGNCSAPNSIQIGYGTVSNSVSSYPAIYSNWYKNARHQILYQASELLAAGILPGKISSLAWNISSVSGTTSYPNFTIKMKCTNVQDLTSTTFDNTGLTQVYFSPSINITTGWNTYTFPTAYEWDGVSNILIDVCSDLTASYTNNSSSPYSVTQFASIRWFNSDVTPACMTTSSATNYSPNNTYRPNIKFENCGASSPSSYSISVSSNGNIIQNFYNDSIVVVPVSTPTADVVYTITVTNPEGGCTASQTFTMSSNLAAYTTYTNASCGSCPNGSVQVIVSCGAGPYSYVWSPGGQTTSSVSGLLPGCYTVTVTDANLNSVTSQACVSFSTKLEVESNVNGLNIFPNPSKGVFNISSELILEKFDVTVINPLGQTILYETAKNTAQLQIDLSKVSRGIYYLKASTNEGTKLFKLILE
jgi:hypothetical protein